MQQLLIGLILILPLAACQTNHRFAPGQVQPLSGLAEQYSASRQEMLRRFPSSNTGSLEARLEAARPLAAAYTARRTALGLPVVGGWSVEDTAAALAEAPVIEARLLASAADRAAVAARSAAAAAELASLDDRTVTAADLNRIVQRRLADQSVHPPATRSDVEAQLRSEISQRRAARASQAIAVRERDLARLATTNLADMPREIAEAAQSNLRDARSPFETRTNWRPSPAEPRGEEVRLRNAIIARQETEQREGQQRLQAQAMQLQREAVLASCWTQAAFIGASVPSPYMGRGLGGALASGFAGAIQQASAESNALQSCLRANGI